MPTATTNNAADAGAPAAPAAVPAADSPKTCCQAGFLPVPLQIVSPQALHGLEIYLANGSSYNLYRAINIDFSDKDQQGLLSNNVNYVYISVRDHQKYYRTMESYINQVVSDPSLLQQKKAEILYSTSLELANQLLQSPPQQEQIDQTKKISHAMVEMVIKNDQAFSSLFDVSSHDFYTATHLVNVCTHSISLAQKLGSFDSKLLEQLGIGSLLHDIGKIFIPEEVLNSPEKLSDEQFTLLRTHVDRGCEHLRSVTQLPEVVMEAIAQHHERLDGSGYPKGLKGEQISSFGRLVGIIDTFDAMTSSRPYRSHTHSVDEALQYLQEQSPQKYDADMVRTFADMILNIINNQQTGEKNDYLDMLEEEEINSLSGRRHKRHYFRAIAEIRMTKVKDSDKKLVPAEKMILHNLSRSGLGFLSPRPFQVGRKIYLTLSQLAGTQCGQLAATIVRCKDYGNGWFTVGAKLTEDLPAGFLDQIKDFVLLQ